MPIYEWRCECGHTFEKLMKANDPTPPCEKCKKTPVKQVSVSNFQLKGGGWFSDGYAGKSNKGH